MTRPAQTTASDSRSEMVLGVARILRAELDMRFATLELEELDSSAASAVLRVTQRIQKTARNANLYDTEAQLSDIKEYTSTPQPAMSCLFHAYLARSSTSTSIRGYLSGTCSSLPSNLLYSLIITAGPMQSRGTICFGPHSRGPLVLRGRIVSLRHLSSLSSRCRHSSLTPPRNVLRSSSRDL